MSSIRVFVMMSAKGPFGINNLDCFPISNADVIAIVSFLLVNVVTSGFTAALSTKKVLSLCQHCNRIK